MSLNMSFVLATIVSYFVFYFASYFPANVKYEASIMPVFVKALNTKIHIKY